MDSVSKKAEKVCKLLIQTYGTTITERKLDPLDELVMAILSQNTNDKNMLRAYESLKSRYSTWQEVLNAPEDELGLVIKSSGFFKVKARRIKSALAEILKRRGSFDISHLAEMSVDDAKQWLTSLNGVGPKSASIVLLFCFGMPTLPVDTHVWRITKRLGLIPANADRERAQVLLERLLPRECILSMNHNLIKHGRNVCLARQPKCETCFLRYHCSYHESLSIA